MLRGCSLPARPIVPAGGGPENYPGTAQFRHLALRARSRSARWQPDIALVLPPTSSARNAPGPGGFLWLEDRHWAFHDPAAAETLLAAFSSVSARSQST